MILNPKFKEYYLSELCDLITDGTHSTHKEQINGKPLATIKDMTGNGINFNSCRMISEEDFNRLKTSNCVPIIDDLLFAKDGSMLKEIFVNKQKEFAITSHIALIRTKKEILEPLYLKYYLSNKSIKDDIISNYSSGSVIPSLILKDINKFQISIPNKKIQLEIVEILSSIDDKIELNDKINKTLEELAQTLYKHWFIDFEFPNEEGKPYQSSGGEMVESDVGLIPKGWRIFELSDFIFEAGIRTKPSSETIDIPYVPIDCITSKSLTLWEYRDGKEAKSSLVSFKAGDILFGAMRPYFHKVCIAPFDGTTRTTCFVLNSKQKEYFAFSILTLFLDSTIQFATQNSTGSTIPYIKWKNGLATLSVSLPPLDIAERFDSFLKPIFKKFQFSLNEKNTLTEIRDLLLPKLMSGEIEV